MSTRIDPETNWQTLRREGHLPRLAVLCFGIWLHAANSMLAATTLPRAVEDIGGAHLIGWAFMLYQLGSILAGAVTGLLVVRFGLRSALVGAACVYGSGCVCAALAPDMPVLLAGRLLQGAGGGWLVALTYVALNRLFPNSLMPRLIALISVIWSASAFCGPLVGGSFATYGLWRLAFWAFAVQTVMFIVAALLMFRDTEPPETGIDTILPTGRLLILAAGILLISFAGTLVHVVWSPLLCVAGLALLGGFIKLDAARPDSRMLASHAFDPRHAVGAGLIMVFAAAASTMSFLVYGPFLLDVLYGVTPLAAGYIVVVESVAWGVAAVVFSSMPLASESRLIRGGVACVSVSILGFALLMPSGPLWTIVLVAALQGGGFGMMWGFVVRRIVALVPEAERERASSSVPVVQQTGFAVGAAASNIVANFAGFAEGVSVAAAQSTAFWVFAAFVPLALVANVAAWKLCSLDRRSGLR